VRFPARLARPFGVAALALATAACAQQASSSPVATTTVDLPKSYRFAPAAITVQAGSTVTWTNNDNFTHNVAFQGEAPRTMAPGEEATRAFPSAGTFAYQCTLHPTDMQGSVIVTGR
jgi:plastocyanin